MKKFYALLSLLFVAVTSMWSQTLPEFSTADDPVYYNVQFVGGNYINVPSEGAAFVTSADKSSDGSLWAFIGNSDDFVMRSKSGQYAMTKVGKATNGQDCPNMFHGTSSLDEAKHLKFYTVNGATEIGLATDNNMGMNSWGGTAAGMSIGMWNHGDKNNKLVFLEEGAKPELGFKFSTPEEMHYYTIRNVNKAGDYAHYDGPSNYLQLGGEVERSAAFYFEEAEGSTGDFTAVYVRAYNAQDLYMTDFNAWGTTKKVWYVRAASQTGVNGCFNICKTTTNVDTDQSTCWNHQSGGIKPWKAAADKGSAWYFEAVDPSELLVSEYFSIKGGQRPAYINDLSLWYDFAPTKTSVGNKWMEYGLPLGNGQIGTVLLGGVLKDQIQFNEKTLYNGSPTAFGNHGIYANFGYINVTDISDTFSKEDESKPVMDYVRYLDIVNGVAGVNFASSNGTKYTRRYFTSAPDKVFVACYKAEGSEKLSLRFALDPDKYIGAGVVTYGENSASFDGKSTTVSYGCKFQVVNTDGTITKTDKGIEVTGATEVMLIMSAHTNFDITNPSCVSGTKEDAVAEVNARVAAAAAKSYSELYDAHVANFSALMNRVSLQLNNAASTKTTKDLVDFYATPTNRTKADAYFLEQLYFQYGRYLEVSCNNITIAAPANLQGIWNNDSNTNFWHCDIHADVNVQMCYWPAETTNLSEMHLPFLQNIIWLSGDDRNYHKVAQRFKSDARGWMLPTENNIFGGCSSWEWNKMKTMSAWNCSHLWQHYRYTLDKEFLKQALPTMLRAAQFIKDISTHQNPDGTYYVDDEYSPEHGPSGHSTAFAQQNAADVVSSLIKGHKELGEESPLSSIDVNEMEDFYAVLDKGLHTEQYNGKTCLKEWYDLTLNSQGDCAGHRHLSHLLALYPFGHVSGFATDAKEKELFQAAVNSLAARSATTVTGWSGGHKINLHARALEGNKAYSYFPLMFNHTGSYTIVMGGQGGLYYNLWDAHSPFQIDGNFGYCSGVAEMLMQSYDDVIHVLPALPSAWKSGRVTGLKAVGGFVVSIEWVAGKPNKVEVENPLGQELRIESDVDLTNVRVETEDGKKLDVTKNGKVYTIALAQGEKAVISYNELPTSVTKIDADSASSKVAYDLQGRLARNNASGVIIMDGRKVIK
ncbi:MAG: glycoside hydrolase N-terminal domain-containing protein [Bacteroidales bacterium]|nr:glycoside hydrolase N-terminal domain-containing protein [Candidatus Physcousia equi]